MRTSSRFEIAINLFHFATALSLSYARVTYVNTGMRLLLCGCFVPMQRFFNIVEGERERKRERYVYIFAMQLGYFMYFGFDNIRVDC